MSPRPLAVAAVSLLLAATPLLARTWHVSPDGTGDAPSIPAAADSAASGDTILVAPGTYVCPDNIDYSTYWVELHAGVSLIGSDGPTNTRIADRTTNEPHYLIACRNTSDCLIKGLGLVRESPRAGSFYGIGLGSSTGSLIDTCTFEGFLYAINIYGAPAHGETPAVQHCLFTHNAVGVYCALVQLPFSPVIRFCTWTTNGWGIHCYNSAPYIADNRISGSSWAGIYCTGQSSAVLDRNTIIDGQRYGLWVDTEPYFEPLLTTDWLPSNGNAIYGNSLYDLYNSVTDQRGVVEARYTFWGTDCPDFATVIGGPGRVNYMPWCDSTHTKVYDECPSDRVCPATWGSVKSLFR